MGGGGPAFGKHDEAMQFIALDDRQLPGASLGDGGRGVLPPVPGISEDKLDEGEEAACAPMRTSRAPRDPHSGRVDDDVHSRPSVSTRICRLRPVTFLAASNPAGQAWSPLLSRFGALTVDDRGGWAGVTALALARGDVERMVDAL